ncbi:peroxide stress protein YaaA [Alkalibaculum sp. M08DMB]|uniref:UPF0246 protein GC105_16330 n=1 Tax=Alkalibaculum sporogenes TaxID=2655001 RepID=A0A6A7KCZ5_9FIRM|nr:peroxide stress protein YaaA [Alkalibaculum sporogenes]MPW27334.1 peroxide stress protein YaaA [Alkalibaculum sporogenes]
MRIIISPAKKMNVDTDSLDYNNLPGFIKDTETLLAYMRELNYEAIKSMWKCSDKIASLNYERIQRMNLYTNLTPAILSYEGIQYQYMAPGIFNMQEYKYIEEHLRILSGFYGILRPFDGVIPYRLEMQAKLNANNKLSLYEYWGSKLSDNLFSGTNCIINLASKEYSKCISNYIKDDTKFITCVFGEIIGNKVVEKGTQVKMARGEMVRFMAENQIEDIKHLKSFNMLNYTFSDHFSNDNNYVFIK